jgi:hypothetical protein
MRTEHYNVTTHNPKSGRNTTTTELVADVATTVARIHARGERLNDLVRVAGIDCDNDKNVGGSVSRYDPNNGLFNLHAGPFVPTLVGTSTARDAKDAPVSWRELLNRATLTLTRQRCSGHRKADNVAGYATQQRAAYPARIDESVVWDSIADTLLDRHVRKATDASAISDYDLAQERPSPSTIQATIGLARVALADRASGMRDVVTGKDPARIEVTEFVYDDEHEWLTTATVEVGSRAADVNEKGWITTAKVRKYASHHDSDVALANVAKSDAALVSLEQREEVAACIAELPDSLRVTALNAIAGGGCPDGVPAAVYRKRLQRMREALAIKFRARGLMVADKN